MASTILFADIATQPIGAALLLLLLLSASAFPVAWVCTYRRARASVFHLAQFVADDKQTAALNPDLLKGAQAGLNCARALLNSGQSAGANFSACLWLNQLEEALRSLPSADSEFVYATTDGEHALWHDAVQPVEFSFAQAV